MSSDLVFACPRCRGAGWVPCTVFDPGSVRGWRPCDSCDGTGQTEADR